MPRGTLQSVTRYILFSLLVSYHVIHSLGNNYHQIIYGENTTKCWCNNRRHYQYCVCEGVYVSVRGCMCL